MSQIEQWYRYVIQMVEGSTYEDINLLEHFRAEDPYHKKSLYNMIREIVTFADHKITKMDNSRAYKILIEAISDYILAHSTSYEAKRRFYCRVYSWCEHMGKQYEIDDYAKHLKDLPQQVATDVTIGLVKELHDQDGISKVDLRNKYGLSEKTFQVCLHKLSNEKCSDPLRIGGQAVHVPVSYKDGSLRTDKRKYYTENTMSPLVYQLNIMQVETLMKSFQLNYDSGNNIPLDLAIDTWGQLSEYARERIKDVFGKKDSDLNRFLELVEQEMYSDEYHFMTESEMMRNKDISIHEQIEIALKGSIVCNISLVGPHRTRKNQRIIYDHSRHRYYAVSADNSTGDRLYFDVNEVFGIEEV